jgi:hypothetical protein
MRLHVLPSSRKGQKLWHLHCWIRWLEISFIYIYIYIYTHKYIYSFIFYSVSRQVQSLFQIELSTYCDLELPPSDVSILSLRSSSSFLRLLPRLPVTSVLPFIFPSITRCRRQFLRKMWPIQLAFRFLISCRIFLCSLSLSNIYTVYIYFTWRRNQSRDTKHCVSLRKASG